MNGDTEAFFAVVGMCALGSLGLVGFMYGIGGLGTFIAKVRDYQTAHEYKMQLDSLQETCNELMNERDALRAELNQLKELQATAYRGAHPAEVLDPRDAEYRARSERARLRIIPLSEALAVAPQSAAEDK